MSNWQPLATQPSSAVDTMLLLTDGSVMCHVYGTPNWLKLIPNPQGDYVNGTWHTLKAMPANAPTNQNGPTNAPLYFASAVLKDGRVFVAGGEYNGGVNFDLLAVEIYDPVADSWTSIANPPGWTNIGDAPTCVLPDGKVILGNINAVGTQIYDPTANKWSADNGDKHDTSSEETWTLLPNQTILVAEVNNHPQSERYVIATGHWVADSSIPAAADLVLNVPGVSIEIGPAILMPNGKVFATGASGHTAIYTPGASAAATGTWVAGPDFPKDTTGTPMRAFDAPAALLPNGHVLCTAGPVITSGGEKGWAGQPTNFFEYDGTNLTQVASPTNAASLVTYNCRLLPLPTGQILLSTCTTDIEVYNPGGAANPAWAPQITSCPSSLQPGQTYPLSGKQLNGLSQAVCYGDDAQMATNYPLVRIRNLTTNHVVYCRTHNHSTMAVATGNTVQSTQFDVPATIDQGPSELTVVANGVSSAAFAVQCGQSNWRWCHKCQSMYFAGNATPGICPAGGSHEQTGSGNYTLVQNMPTAPGQDNWRWCRKCQGMTFAGNPSLGTCPAGATHDHTSSGDYRLVQNVPADLGQHDWRWCNKCQGLNFAGNFLTGACPAGGGHDDAGSGNYKLVQNSPGAAGQDNWRWCRKCQGLAFAGNPSLGPCPAGGTHDHTGSGDYLLQDATGAPGQDNWRWCRKCQGMAFAGNPTLGPCPAGGTHDHTGSGDYRIVHDNVGAPGQANWRWCHKCQGLYFAANLDLGVCPAGGGHNTSDSGDYSVMLG